MKSIYIFIKPVGFLGAGCDRRARFFTVGLGTCLALSDGFARLISRLGGLGQQGLIRRF